MKFKSSQLTESKIVDYSCPRWVLSKRPGLWLLHTTTTISQLAAPSSGQSSITQLLRPAHHAPAQCWARAELRCDWRRHTSNANGATTGDSPLYGAITCLWAREILLRKVQDYYYKFHSTFAQGCKLYDPGVPCCISKHTLTTNSKAQMRGVQRQVTNSKQVVSSKSLEMYFYLFTQTFRLWRTR